MRRPGWLAYALAASLGTAAMFAQQPPQQPAKQQPPPAPKTHLKVGDAAPDFSLKDNNGKTVKLKSYRGKKNVVLAFYVIAFTGG